MIRPAMAALCGLLASCSLLRAPSAPTPEAGSQLFPSADIPTHTATAAELISWWVQFDDPQLTALVTRALDTNDELAAERAREAAVAAEARIADSALLPVLDLEGQAGKSKDLERLPLPPVGTKKEVDLAASWQVDLFGALRAGRDAVRWSARAQTERRHAVAVTIIADTVTTYMAYQADLAHTDVLRRSIALQRAIADLAAAQVAVGVATRAERESSEAQFSSLAATLPLLEKQQQVHLHHLAVLTGIRPQAFSAPTPRVAQSFATLSSRPEILPSQLLLQRPDLRGAYDQVRAASASVGAAKAAFFPVFSLGLSGGRQWINAPAAPPFAKVATAATGNVYALGAGAVLPIFNAGQLRAELHGARAGFDEAVHRYNHDLLAALEDVDNASSAMISSIAARERWLQAEHVADHAAVDAQHLYTAGRLDDLARLNAEQHALEAEDGRVSADLSLELSMISIYRAFGGGWGDQNSRLVKQ